MMTTECSVCYESYEQEGEKCPKLLPCSHTVCLQCIRHLGQHFYICCPKCRKSHRVPPEGVGGFPTNRYILENLALVQRAAELEESPEQTVLLLDETVTGNEEVICDLHNKACILFCANTQCRERLCPVCPIQNHVNHNLVTFRHEHVRIYHNNDKNIGKGEIKVIEEVHITIDEETDVDQTLSETDNEAARSFRDSVARNTACGVEVDSGTTKEHPSGIMAESLEETEGGISCETEVLPRNVETNRDLRDDQPMQILPGTEDNKTNYPRKNRKKCTRCLKVFLNVLGYFLGVIGVICLGAVVTVGVMATYVVYIVCWVAIHVNCGICTVGIDIAHFINDRTRICDNFKGDYSNKECCYCIGDIKERFKKSRDRIESFLTKCKDCTERCFSSCGGCHNTTLSVVCSLVFYFVIGVVAVVAVVVTGVLLVVEVPIYSVLFVACCVILSIALIIYVPFIICAFIEHNAREYLKD